MKVSDPLPHQHDALRTAVSLAEARDLPAQNIDLVIQLEEQKQLLAAIAPAFLSPNEFAVIARTLDLDGQGCQSRRAIAGELQMSLAMVLDYERDALASINQHFARAFEVYKQQKRIERKAQCRAFA